MVEQIVISRNSLPSEVTHSWEGGRAKCYHEKFIVNRGEAVVDNEISRGNLGVPLCSTTLSAICYFYNGILLRHCTFQRHTNQTLQTNTHSPIIVRGNNLLYHPLSYVLFVLLYWMFFSPGFILFYDFDALNFNCCCL